MSDLAKPEMLTFRCTQKAFDLLGLSDRDLSDEAQEDFVQWFVDVSPRSNATGACSSRTR